MDIGRPFEVINNNLSSSSLGEGRGAGKQHVEEKTPGPALTFADVKQPTGQWQVFFYELANELANELAKEQVRNELEKEQGQAKDDELPAGIPQLSKPVAGELNSSALQLFLKISNLDSSGRITEEKKQGRMQEAFAQQSAKSHEAQENARLAEAAEKELEEKRKNASIWEKVFGWVMSVVSVVLAAPTGGASLALAVFCAVDMAQSEETKFSVIGKILEPLINEAILPAIEAIAKVITDELKNLGMADEAAAIMGQITAAIAVVAVTLLAAAGAKKLPTELLTKQISKFAAKAVPDILKNGSKTLTKSIRSFLGGKELAQILTARMEKVALVAGVADKAGVRPGMNIDIALTEKEVQMLEANLQRIFADNDFLSKTIEHLWQEISRRMEAEMAGLRNAFESFNRESEGALKMIDMISGIRHRGRA
ncbi:type III secretion system translocon subunit SctE [Pseudomonas batumici]|uniref:type III secretion system translocon subunit SctE n=1 Tax=Pseudomonas batumici TaxID=226910 RepID=UPI0030CEE001